LEKKKKERKNTASEYKPFGIAMPCMLIKPFLLLDLAAEAVAF